MGIAPGKKSGFTLVEILVVLIALAILAGMLLLTFGPGTEKAKQTVCVANRVSFEHAYNLYKTTESDPISLDAFVNSPTDETRKLVDRIGRCPDDGKYTVSEDEYGHQHLLCSVHDKDNDSTASGSFVPGTTVEATHAWSGQSDLEKALAAHPGLSVKKGDTLKIGDKFYIYTGGTFALDAETRWSSNNPFNPNGWMFSADGTPNGSLVLIPVTTSSAQDWSSYIGGEITRGTAVSATDGGVTRYFVRTWGGTDGKSTVYDSQNPLTNLGSWAEIK